MRGMNGEAKKLAEAITNARVHKAVENHVKKVKFDEVHRHLWIYFDNVSAIHFLSDKKNDERLRKGLEKVYDKDITYELKQYVPDPSDREKGIPRDIHEKQIEPSIAVEPIDGEIFIESRHGTNPKPPKRLR